MEIDTPEASKPTQHKRQQAPPSVTELESNNDSSAPPPVKKRKREEGKVKDQPATSIAAKRQRKRTSNPASHKGED